MVVSDGSGNVADEDDMSSESGGAVSSSWAMSYHRHSSES